MTILSHKETLAFEAEKSCPIQEEPRDCPKPAEERGERAERLQEGIAKFWSLEALESIDSLAPPVAQSTRVGDAGHGARHPCA